MLRKIKDKFYWLLVDKNDFIRTEYISYIFDEDGIRIKGKLRSLLQLLKLNVKYRIFLKKDLSCQDDFLNEARENYDNKTVGNSNTIKTHRKTSSKKINKKSTIELSTESDMFNKIPVQHFIKPLIDSDVVSFDIFDTLVHRPFGDPKDLFDFLEVEFQIQNFRNIRVTSESVARKRNSERYGSREVTLNDIYAVIYEKININVEQFMKREKELEIEFICTNPYMKKVYDIVRENGIRIIASTDMYLDRESISAILEKCGYEVDALYLSSEQNCSKRDLGLYKHINTCEGFTPDMKFTHVGDNWQTDVLNARKMGWESIYYKNVNKYGNDLRPKKMTRLVGGAYKGIVNSHLYNGLNHYNAAYEYGFIYGGILLLGYANWIHKECQQNDTDKILFLARDGHMFQKVYNYLKKGESIPNEYLYWSRSISRKVNAGITKEFFLQQSLDYKLRSKEVFRVKDILHSIGADFLLDKIKKHNVHEKDIFASSNIDKIRFLINENWEELLDIYDDNIDATFTYLKEVIGDSKKITLVDVGWQGTSILELKRIIESIPDLNVKVNFLTLGYSGEMEFMTPFFISGAFNSYLWTSQHNRHLYAVHNSIGGMNNVLIDSLCSNKYPSLKSINKSEQFRYEFEFGDPEVGNHKYIDDMNDGMMDFIRIYVNTFKSYEFMYNISAHNAYMPFSTIWGSRIEVIKEHFSDFVVSRTGISNGNEEIYSLKNVIDEFMSN